MLLVHRAAVNRASFGADAHTIVTASDDGTARLCTIPRAQANDAATLADLAEAVSRQTIGNWGELVALPNRDSIIARLRTHSTQQRASTSDLDRMLAELFSAHGLPRSKPRRIHRADVVVASWYSSPGHPNWDVAFTISGYPSAPDSVLRLVGNCSHSVNVIGWGLNMQAGMLVNYIVWRPALICERFSSRSGNGR
jgi:hypothetical protein